MIKALVTVTVFVLVGLGLYFGPRMLQAHAAAHESHPNYVMVDKINQIVRQANHTPATMGAFRSDADISQSDVVSVVTPVK